MAIQGECLWGWIKKAHKKRETGMLLHRTLCRPHSLLPLCHDGALPRVAPGVNRLKCTDNIYNIQKIDGKVKMKMFGTTPGFKNFVS